MGTHRDEAGLTGIYKRGYQLYLEGKYEEAISYLVIDANKNHEPSQSALGLMYMNGLGVKIDYSKAVIWFMKSAYHNNPLSDATVATIYHYGGPGLEPDYEKAVFWYKNCIVHDYIKSVRAIANLYIDGGCGLNKDYGEAIYWLTKLALSKNDNSAMYRIATLYLEGGFGIMRDYEDAIFWLDMASENGNLDAKFKLGKFYQKGGTVEQDYERSLKFFEDAEHGNCIEAIFEIGSIYEYGYGVEVDYKKAFDYYKKAADLGENHAQLKLGKIYLEGWENIAIDKGKAMTWLQRSISNGNEEAQLIIHELETPKGVLLPMVKPSVVKPSVVPKDMRLKEAEEKIARLMAELELQRYEYKTLKESMTNKKPLPNEPIKNSEPKKFFHIQDNRERKPSSPMKFLHVENRGQTKIENHQEKTMKFNTAAPNSNEQEDQKKKKQKKKFFKL